MLRWAEEMVHRQGAKDAKQNLFLLASSAPWRLISLLLPLLAARTASADDWLAALPECAGERVPAGAQLLYPRPGLPALVAAGDTLIVRARLSLPLTPPPGVQQERALEDFEAQLVGHAQVLSGQLAPQSTPLEVVNVRPEGPSSLRYRLSVPVPAWVAPGTYDLRLRAKGASLSAPSAVRVLASADPPRLGAAGDRVRLDPRAAVHAPIDLWVETTSTAIAGGASLPDAIAGGSAAPVLRTAGLVGALRVGDALWVLGGCTALHLPFEVEVASVLRAEGRRRVADVKRAGLKPAPTGEGFDERNAGPIDGARGSASPSAVGPGFKPGLFEPISGGWQLNHSGAALELSVLIAAAPGSPGLRAEPGALRFYPAGDVVAAPHVLIARWSVPALPAGERARLLRVPAAPLIAQLRVEPDPVRGDSPVRVSADADRPLAALALRFDHRHTAYGLAPVEHRYRALGEHRVHGIAIAADGTAVGVRADATVVTARGARGPGCGVAAPVPRARPVWAGPGLWLSVLLLQRRLLKRRRR
jgi:hypothetical protein